MTLPKITVLLFFIAGLLFLLVAVLPALRGDELNITFFVLAIVFGILALANLKKVRGDERSSDSEP